MVSWERLRVPLAQPAFGRMVRCRCFSEGAILTFACRHVFLLPPELPPDTVARSPEGESCLGHGPEARSIPALTPRLSQMMWSARGRRRGSERGTCRTGRPCLRNARADRVPSCAIAWPWQVRSSPGLKVPQVGFPFRFRRAATKFYGIICWLFGEQREKLASKLLLHLQTVQLSWQPLIKK